MYFPFSKNSEAAASTANLIWSVLYPAFSTASRITSKASFTFGKCGANPPSSPTPMASPRAARIFFRL